MFTHTSWDDHRVLLSQMAGDGSRTTERVVPYAIFTDPELGRVGMTEREAREAGYEVEVMSFDMEREKGKALEIGENKGLIKVVADASDGRILGAAVLTAEGVRARPRVRRPDERRREAGGAPGRRPHPPDARRRYPERGVVGRPALRAGQHGASRLSARSGLCEASALSTLRTFQVLAFSRQLFGVGPALWGSSRGGLATSRTRDGRQQE